MDTGDRSMDKKGLNILWMTLWLNMLDAWNLWYFKNVECGCLFLARTNSKKKNWKSSNHWYHKIIISKMFKIDIFKARNQEFELSVFRIVIHNGQIWSRKIKSKAAILILFKNVTTFYTNIKKFFFGQTEPQTDKRTDRWNHGNIDIEAQIAVQIYWYLKIPIHKIPLCTMHMQGTVVKNTHF